MKVYIVVNEWRGEIEQVLSSKESAEDWVAKNVDDFWKKHYEIYEWDVK